MLKFFSLNLIEVILNIFTTFISHEVFLPRYIKNNGDVSVQKNISRERPSYRAQKVACQAKLIQVACQDDVVWVVTEARSIFVRTGIKAGTEEGTDWIPLSKFVVYIYMKLA